MVEVEFFIVGIIGELGCGCAVSPLDLRYFVDSPGSFVLYGLLSL